MKWMIVIQRWRLGRGGSSHPVRRVGDDQGLVLPLTLMAFLVLGVLAAALLSIGSSEIQIASNHLRNTQAQFLAEAGLEHAYNTLRTTPNLVTTATAALQNIVSLAQLGSMGNYDVWYQRMGPNTMRVVSTGISAIGGSQQIRRATMSTTFISNDAIKTNGDLNISGNVGVGDPVFQGQCGSVHSNANLDIGGSTSISGNATASGNYDASGGVSVGSDSGGHRPEEFIPVINPTDFLNAATASLPANQVFQMKANGQILRGDGSPITTLADGGNFNGWNYNYTADSPAQWSLSSNTSENGTYYFEGNVSVSGNHGDVSTPWVVTLIATGDLIIAGSSVTQSSLTDTLFIAGLDLKISGTTGQTQEYNGLLAAHEQFKLTGTPTINGFLIGEDASATSSTVTSNAVNGNPTINYSCGLNPPLQGPLQFISWGL